MSKRKHRVRRGGIAVIRGRKFFCVFKIGSSIQLELDM